MQHKPIQLVVILFFNLVLTGDVGRTSCQLSNIIFIFIFYETRWGRSQTWAVCVHALCTYSFWCRRCTTLRLRHRHKNEPFSVVIIRTVIRRCRDSQCMALVRGESQLNSPLHSFIVPCTPHLDGCVCVCVRLCDDIPLLRVRVCVHECVHACDKHIMRAQCTPHISIILLCIKLCSNGIKHPRPPFRTMSSFASRYMVCAVTRVRVLDKSPERCAFLLGSLHSSPTRSSATSCRALPSHIAALRFTHSDLRHIVSGNLFYYYVSMHTHSTAHIIYIYSFFSAFFSSSLFD